MGKLNWKYGRLFQNLFSGLETNHVVPLDVGFLPRNGVNQFDFRLLLLLDFRVVFGLGVRAVGEVQNLIESEVEDYYNEKPHEGDTGRLVPQETLKEELQNWVEQETNKYSSK